MQTTQPRPVHPRLESGSAGPPRNRSRTGGCLARTDRWLTRARRVLAGFAVLTTLPYLGLKVSWLIGGRAGIIDPAFGHSTTLFVLNVVTAGLDVVALVLGVLLFRGARAPAWLVLPPLWVGAGLLGQILLAAPLMLLASAGPSRASSEPVPPLETWVYALVYGGFAGLGVGLLGAFAIHAVQRWGGQPVPPSTAAARTALTLAGLACLVGGVAHLVLSDVARGSRVLDLMVAAVAAGALLLLTRSRDDGAGEGTARAAVVVAFVATGALVAWGTYLGVLTLFPNEVTGRTDVDWPTVLASALRLLAVLTGAIALLSRLHPPRRSA